MYTDVTPACDIFSLGLVAYEALSKQQLLAVGDELLDYKSKVASIGHMDFSSVSQQFQCKFAYYNLLYIIKIHEENRVRRVCYRSTHINLHNL